MSEHRDVLERTSRRVSMPEPAFDRLTRRRDRKQRNERLTAAVVALALVAAFAAGVTVTLHRNKTFIRPAHPSPAAVFALPTSGWTPGAGGEQARLVLMVEGEPQPGGGCVWLEGRGGVRTSVVWPAGFHARFNPVLEILDGNRNVVAREGQTIEVAGGFFGLGNTQACLPGEHEPFFIQSPITVVGDG